MIDEQTMLDILDRVERETERFLKTIDDNLVITSDEEADAIRAVLDMLLRKYHMRVVNMSVKVIQKRVDYDCNNDTGEFGIRLQVDWDGDNND